MAHGHDHALTDLRSRQRRVLWWVLIANGGFMVVEFVGGVVFDSLALLADAFHMASDVGALAIALVTHSLMDRPATARHSFGLQRAEVLGAQANGIILAAASIWIVVEAVQRLGRPVEVEGGGLLVVATLGLLVNIGSAVALARVRGQSLNMRGALLHMIADAAGSVAAIAAGVAVVVASADWVDPVASIVISVLVLWAAYGLLRDATRILLEGTPEGLDPDDVAAAIEAQSGVESAHHLHIWSLASDEPALSAHVILEGELDLHEAQLRGDAIRSHLRDEFGIDHATLELECHECDVPTVIPTPGRGPVHGH